MELSVVEFLKAVNEGLRGMRAVVTGEVTGRVNRRGGVTYFSLHDATEDAVLNCMGINSILDRLGIEIKEGMAIKVSGYTEIWPRTGSFTFKAFEVLLTGEGDLKRQFEALVKKLEAEGLFAPERKKQLPSFITRIGLITAVAREAMNDFLKHLPRHGLDIVLRDVRVEGAQAVEQICAAIASFNEYALSTEVLVITRGGGSLESLQAFNAEVLARAIVASRIPIISAIGHERDVTIADFAADVRASTPTHAAKIIGEDWITAPALLRNLEQEYTSRMYHLMRETQHRLVLYSADWRSVVSHRFDLLQQRLEDHRHKLRLADPHLKLRQGYSILRGKDDRIIRSVAQIRVGDRVEAQLYDGTTQLQKNL